MSVFLRDSRVATYTEGGYFALGGISTPMFVRTTEFTRIVRLLISRTSVDLVGTRWSGRTEILRRVHQRLTAEGYTVITIRGVTGNLPLEAVRIALPDAARKTISHRSVALAPIVDALEEIIQAGPAVIVVADAALLANPSWFVLETLHKSIGVPILTASLRSRIGDPAEHRLVRIAHPAVLMTLRELSPETVNDIVSDRIGGPISPDLAGRIHAKSAGIAGYVVAITDAVLDANLLTKHNGIWFADFELWSEDLNGAFESLLHSYPIDQQEALEILSLVGVTDHATALALIGNDTLELLEANGLVKMITAGRRTLIAVNPPGIAEYFRHQEVSSRRLRLVGHIRQILPGIDTESTAGYLDDAWASTREPVDERRRVFQIVDLPAVGRMFSEQQALNLAVATRAWELAPDHAAARDLLVVELSDSEYVGDLDPDVLDVLDTAAVSNPTQALFDAYLVSRARYASGKSVESVVEPYRRGRDLPPEYARAFEVLSYLSTMEAVGISADYEIEIGAMLGGRGVGNLLAMMALVIARTLSSRGADALALLDEVDDELRSLRQLQSSDGTAAEDLMAQVEKQSHYFRGLALFASGRNLEAAQWAKRNIESAIATLDREALSASAYVATLTMMTLSRFEEANEMSGLPNRTNIASPLLFFAPDLALPVLQSVVTARAGRTAASDALANMAAGLVRSAALPGGTTAWLRPFALLQDGQRSRTRRAFAELSATLNSAGYTLAADIALLMGVVSKAQPDGESDEILAAIERSGGSIFELYLRGRIATVSERPDELMAAAKVLRELGAEPAALSYSVQAARLYRESGLLDDANVARDVIRELTRAGFATEIPGYTTSGDDSLTIRELEIAQLIRDGLTNPQIAEKLVISTRTVESHINKIRRKTGAVNRLDVGGTSLVG